MHPRFAPATWAVAAMASASFVSPEAAATHTVTSLSDSGPGSLRQVIADTEPDQTIQFSVSGTIILGSELVINKNLTITGPGSTVLSVSGNNTSRVFRISSGTVTVSGLRIQNGRCYGNDGGAAFNNNANLTVQDCTLANNSTPDLVDIFTSYYGRGGAVLNRGNATFINCVIQGSQSTQGGAVYNGSTLNGGGSARLAMNNCTLAGNQAVISGAAIDNRDRLRLTNCKLTSNAGTDANWDGATLYNYGTAILEGSELRFNSGANMFFAGIANDSYLEMNGCTVAANRGKSGGALWNSGIARLTNCTISGNTATLNETAGGVDTSCVWRDAISTLAHCTISSNVDAAANAASAVFCGVYGTGLKATVTLSNCIVTKQASAPSLFVLTTTPGAGITSLGYNLASDSPVWLSSATDVRGVDPVLAGLQNNGGSVLTIAPNSGSPAIDMGSPAGFPATDARGIFRPMDGDNDGVFRSDIGACEVASAAPLPSARTGVATKISGAGATLNAIVNPNGTATSARFEWGTDVSYGNASPDQDLGNSTQDVVVTLPLTGLSAGSTCHYRVVATCGGHDVAGADASFPVPNGGPGTALSFEPAGRYVDLPPATYFTGDLTIEGWVRVWSHRHMARLIEFGNGSDSDNVTVALSDAKTGRPWFQVYNAGSSAGTVLAPSALLLNKWTHIACTLSGTTGRIYVNGVLVASGTTSAPRNVTRSSNYIGWHNWRLWSSFDDRLPGFPDAVFDEIRVWSVARSADDIRRTMNAVLDPDTPGLMTLYRFDEGSGTVVQDSGPRGLHGAIVGPPAWVSSTAPIVIGPAKFTLDDVIKATRIAAGIVAANSDDIARLNVETVGTSAGCIDINDACRIARKVAGLDSNP